MSKLWISLLTLIIFLSFLTCKNDGTTNKSNEKTVEEIKTDGQLSASELVRMPVTADGPTDTINVAKMEFEESSYLFGAVNEGDQVDHTFKFTNTGKMPLLIIDAKSTCGCTVPTWPKTPIEAGGKGEIKVKFNTTGKKGKQSKPITVIANTYPNENKVFLVGTVLGKE